MGQAAAPWPLQRLCLTMAPKKIVFKRPAAAKKAKQEDAADQEAEEPQAPEPAEQHTPARKEKVQSPARAATPSPAPTVRSTMKRPEVRPSEALSLGMVQKPEPRKEAVGAVAVHFTVSSDATRAPLAEGLVQLRRTGHRCDATVVVGGGGRIPVHQLVLCSQSMALDQRLQGSSSAEVDLTHVSHEAANIAVRWMYGELAVEAYDPTTAQVNEEVLKLSTELGLPRLAQICASHLARGVTIANVVERVRLCEAYGLTELRKAIITAIVDDRAALTAVSSNPATMGHPVLMHELLANIASRAMHEDAEVGDERPTKLQKTTH